MTDPSRDQLHQYFRGWGFSAEDAEDLVQETQCRVYLGCFDPKRGVKHSTFVYAIARNAACDKLRGRRRQVPIQVPPDVCDTDWWENGAASDQISDASKAIDPQRDALQTSLLDALVACTAKLSKGRQRIIRYLLRDLAPHEIASILGCSRANVSQQTTASLLTLKRCLELKGFQEETDGESNV